MINELFVTEKVKVHELVPRADNPRKIKADEKRKLWERIKRFGMISIPVRDADGSLLGGKQRCELLVDYGLGDIEIDVRTATRKLTTEELKEVMIIENSHAGEWDMEKLKAEFDDFLNLDEFNILFDEMEEQLGEVLQEEKPELPIVAKFSEKYSAFVIVCQNEIDENHLAEKLGIDREQCYKSKNIGITHVVGAKKVIERWK